MTEISHIWWKKLAHRFTSSKNYWYKKETRMNLKNTMLEGKIQTKRDTPCMSLFVWSSKRGWNNLWWQREQCLPVGGWENNSKNEGTFSVNENVPYLDCGNGYTGEYIYHYSSDFYICLQPLHFTLWEFHLNKKGTHFSQIQFCAKCVNTAHSGVKTSISDHREEMLLVLYLTPWWKVHLTSRYTTVSFCQKVPKIMKNIVPSISDFPKGNQSWIFTGRTDAVAEAPILWPPDVKRRLIRKDPDAGKDWEQDDRWDGWVASLTQCIWASFGR